MLMLPTCSTAKCDDEADDECGVTIVAKSSEHDAAHKSVS